MSLASESPDLARLTGVRSGKRSYYRAYVRSDERLQRAVRAMDSISRGLVRTVEGPRGLLEQVAYAAAEHVGATWLVLGLTDGALPGARPRFVAIDGAADRLVDDEEALPTEVRRELGLIRAGVTLRVPNDDRWVRVPMTLSGRPIGCLIGRHALGRDPDPGDLSVLRILANQAAVSLHTSEQYQAGMVLHRRAQRLYDETAAQAQDLAERTRELRQTREHLVAARQRELLDHERHRIARELHDTVTQHVLSAGLAVELARGLAADLDRPDVEHQLAVAKDLSGQAVDQLRRAIYALHRPRQEQVQPLPALVREVAQHHAPRLPVELRVDGEVHELPADADHEIVRAVGEALFNVVAHAGATRALVRLRYRPDELLVTVSDDGSGEPSALAQRLRLERGMATDGRHRGLVNMEARLVDLHGTLVFRRARIGGVRVEMRIPLPVATRGPGLIAGLVGSAHPQEAS